MALTERTTKVLETGLADQEAAAEIVVTIDNASAGIVAPDSISNSELGTDVKVGSLAALTTTDKTSVQAAINEVNGIATTLVFTGTPATISPTAALAAAPTFSGTPDTISPTAALAAAPTFTAGTRSTNYVSLVGDATACANTDNENLDGAEIASADCVGAYSTVAAGTWAVGALTNPDYARNVAISIKNDSGGPLNLFEGVMTFTITGTDYADGALSETITFTSTAGDKALATANYRGKYGVKAFKTVTAVTLDNVCDDGLKIGVGKGGKVSFHGVLKTPAEGDVIQVVEDGSVLVITGNVDTTNGTFNFDTIAGSKIISMLYQVMSGATGTVSAPAITVTGAAYTPAGTVSTPAITVTGAAYTPAGSVA